MLEPENKEKTFRSNLLEGIPSFGSWITLGHLSIAEVMADAGFDWLCVDMEHSVISYYEAEQLIATIQSKGLFPFVRVGENNPLIIKRVMDAGAGGVIVPMVNSKEDAERAVRAVKYPPVGTRGVGLARAQGYGFTFESYAKSVNANSVVIAQIEHINAIKNLKEIISVDGIDGTIVGPYDLSASLGNPGQYHDPVVAQALAEYEQVGLQFKKPIGFHVIQPDYQNVVEKLNKGYKFVAFSLDTLFLGASSRHQVRALKEHLKAT